MTRFLGSTEPCAYQVAESPYRGLKAFGEGDAAFFCGRETATRQVLERASRCLDGIGMLAMPSACPRAFSAGGSGGAGCLARGC